LLRHIVQLLALRQSRTDLDKVIEECLYSFIIYSLFVLYGHGLPFSVIPAKPPVTETTITWNREKLLVLCMITAAVAIAAALYVNLDGNWLFRKIRVTERTARRPFGTMYFSYYSDAAEDCSIYLSQASSGPGILLTKNANIQSISLLDPEP
jgi:hypothetical protein